jgi:DNA repair protein RadC
VATRRRPPRLAEAPALLDLTPATEGDAVAGVAGHRQRLRDRFLSAGAAALADHEMLEMILFAVPRCDTKPCARALLSRFGSFGQVIAAPVPALLAVEGIGEAAAVMLKLVHAAAVRLLHAEVIGQSVLNNWDRLMDYLNAQLAREPVEQFRVLFLDNKNRLLADEAQQRGTVNHTPVYPREVAKRALELHASAIIVVHNHPSGDPTPSRDDIAMTQQIKAAVGALSIVLHDHVIVGRGRWLSFHREGLL